MMLTFDPPPPGAAGDAAPGDPAAGVRPAGLAAGPPAQAASSADASTAPSNMETLTANAPPARPRGVVITAISTVPGVEAVFQRRRGRYVAADIGQRALVTVTAVDLGSLVWRHPAPDDLADALRALGFEPLAKAGPEGYVASLGRARLEIVPADGLEGLSFTGGPSPIPALLPTRLRPGEPRPPSAAPGIVAIGVATVDVARLALELFDDPAPADVLEPVLAARGLAARSGEPRLIVLEPAAEGRLAAALARYGEGPVALYLRPLRPIGEKFATRLGRARAWPLGGAARLWRPERPWGPFLFVVEDEPVATSARDGPSRPEAAGRRPGVDASGRSRRPGNRS
jgi:hypothetical protein